MWLLSRPTDASQTWLAESSTRQAVTPRLLATLSLQTRRGLGTARRNAQPEFTGGGSMVRFLHSRLWKTYASGVAFRSRSSPGQKRADSFGLVGHGCRSNRRDVDSDWRDSSKRDCLTRLLPVVVEKLPGVARVQLAGAPAEEHDPTSRCVTRYRSADDDSLMRRKSPAHRGTETLKCGVASRIRPSSTAPACTGCIRPARARRVSGRGRSREGRSPS